MKHASGPDGAQAPAAVAAPATTSGPASQLKSDLRTASYAEGRQMVSPEGGGAVQMSGGGPAVQMQAGPKLVAAIDVNSPPTYDAAGGHSYGRHGAHTTEEQHRTRIRSGVAPNGDSAPVPSSAPGSSKFDSDGLHQQALEKGLAKVVDKNKSRTDPATFKGLNSKIGMPGAGTIYKREGGSEPAKDVHVDLTNTGDGTFNLNTAFPTE